MIGERLEVPKPKPNGTAVQLEEDTLTILTWTGYSPKTGRGLATKTTWRFKDADTQVILIDVAIFSGTSWEAGFSDPGRVVPDSHKRIARKYGRSRYAKQKFKGLVLSDPARKRDELETGGPEARGSVSSGTRLDIGGEGAPEAPTSEHEALDPLALKSEGKESSSEAAENSDLDLSRGSRFKGKREAAEFALLEGLVVADEADDHPGSVLIPEHELVGNGEGPERLPARMAFGNRGKSVITTGHLVESGGTENTELPCSLTCEGQAPKLELPGLNQAPRRERMALMPDENPREITKWMFSITIFLLGLRLALWANYDLISSLLIAAYASLGATYGLSYLLTRRHTQRP
ncbi:MAG: hypothetical protein ACE5R6_10995 [Candidatus Heimdallarchaeota archaeon]